MAKAPFAAWWGPIPTTNYRVGRTTPLNGGMVVHHVDGSLASADGEFKRYGSQKSAHYGVDFDGSVVCWVDPDDTAYAACASNWQGYIEVECASDSNDKNGPPTAAQIAALGQIAQFHGIPGHPVETMGGAGIGYHRQFPGLCDTHWGQTDCPGDGFVAAIPAICAAAHGGSTPPSFTEGSSRMIAVCHIQGHTDLFTVTSDNKVWWKHDGNPPTVLTVNGNAKYPEITKDGEEIIYFRGPDTAAGPQFVKATNGGFGWTAAYA